MTVKELKENLNLTVFSGESGLNKTVDGGYVSDLLSDVMGHAEMDNVWVTLQTHKNIMAIASLKELSAIILVKGLTPDEDCLKQSNEEGIPILGTNEQTFEITGKLYCAISKL
ncbi:MAG: serine kinase [Bacteroidales bacterium]|jgi:predicted transcriptional regulator|nr:serine kinase [Bacteroidales bacterium]